MEYLWTFFIVCHSIYLIAIGFFLGYIPIDLENYLMCHVLESLVFSFLLIVLYIIGVIKLVNEFLRPSFFMFFVVYIYLNYKYLLVVSSL